MGVYIPNMDKPKECKECQWHLDFYIEDKQVGGLCTITEKDDKENDCPLIEIPTPHGRLIDAREYMRKAYGEELMDDFNKILSVGLTDEVPTILEAEE